MSSIIPSYFKDMSDGLAAHALQRYLSLSLSLSLSLKAMPEVVLVGVPSSVIRGIPPPPPRRAPCLPTPRCPADILDPVWHSIVNFLDLNARQQVHLSFLPPAERSPPSAVSWPASLTPNVLPKRVGEVTFVLVPNDGTQVAASAGEAGC